MEGHHERGTRERQERTAARSTVRGRARIDSVHVLGIDVGGTKTVCLLGDERGQIVASARGPGANLQAAGELGLEKVLHR